jgi:hypothetical protein
MIGRFRMMIRSCVVRSIDPETNLEDAVFHAVSDAVEEAGAAWDAIDAVGIATSDLPEGRIIQSMVTAGASGAVGKPLLTVASSSEHALVAAYLQLLAGLATTVVVASWSKTSESADLARVDSLGTDPIFNRSFGLTPVVMTALAESMEAGAPRAEATAETDPQVPFPLVRDDIGAVTDAVTAMVVTSDLRDGGLCSVRGVGWSSTTLDLALRGEPLEAVRSAASAAYAMAGTGHEPPDADIVEVQSSSSRLGRRMADAAGVDHRDPPDAPGGSPHDNAAFVGGLATVASVARQLSDIADADTRRNPLGVAVCGSGFHAQNATVFVLEGAPA